MDADKIKSDITNDSVELKASSRLTKEENDSATLQPSNNETADDSAANSNNLKSEIMLVHEYAYRLKKSVLFEVFFLLKCHWNKSWIQTFLSLICFKLGFEKN